MSGVFDAAAAIAASMDDNGFLPADEDFTGPADELEEEVEQEEDEVVEDVEDEDEDEEDTEDEEDEESEEDPEAESKDETTDQLFDIEIDGEEYEVNLEELKSGYLRNEALVKRQTELETSFQAKEQEIEQERAGLTQEYENVLWMQAMEMQPFRNVNWEQLKQLDPVEYKEKRLAYNEAQERFQATRQRVAEITKLNEEAQAIKHKAYVEAQIKLAQELIPEFKEPDFKDKLVAYGEKIGFTKEELEGIADAKQLLVLNQARLYAESLVRRKEAEKKKVSKEVPPVLKPGAPKTAEHGKARQAKASRDAFGKSRSVQDAARVFLDSGVFD